MSDLLVPYHDARDVAAICADLRVGRGAYVLFGTSTAAFLEVAGPKGLPAWSFLCNAPVPQLCLRTDPDGEPLVVAAASRGFPRALDEIAAKASPLLGDQTPALRALLAALLGTAATMRVRVPAVAEIVTEEGEPTLSAWASCLPLGVLQRCIDRAVKIRSAA